MAEAAGHAAAAMAQAIKASGVLVSVEPPTFLPILSVQDEPLIIRVQAASFTPTGAI